MDNSNIRKSLDVSQQIQQFDNETNDFKQGMRKYLEKRKKVEKKVINLNENQNKNKTKQPQKTLLNNSKKIGKKIKNW